MKPSSSSRWPPPRHFDMADVRPNLKPTMFGIEEVSIIIRAVMAQLEPHMVCAELATALLKETQNIGALSHSRHGSIFDSSNTYNRLRWIHTCCHRKGSRLLVGRIVVSTTQSKDRLKASSASPCAPKVLNRRAALGFNNGPTSIS